MAYIKHFRVTKLAGRELPVERELDRHVNVFWGLNGAGKTTLLKILHAALENETRGLDELPFESAEVTFHSTLDGTPITRSYSNASAEEEVVEEEGTDLFLTGEIANAWLDADDDEETTGQWVTSSTGDVPVRRLAGRFQHSYLPITRVTDPYMTYRESPSGYYVQATERSSPDQQFVRQVRNKWTTYNSKSLARIRDIQQQGLATVLAILFGGIPGEALPVTADVGPSNAFEMVRNFLKEQDIDLALSKVSFEQRYQTSADHRRVVVEIEDVRRAIAEALMPQRELQSVIDEMYAGNKHLILSRTPTKGVGARQPPISVRLGDKSIPLNALSSGEKQLLQILLEGLSAGGDTVMIDEPELSMHVDWQQRLVGSLHRVNSECQLLLATHSPEVMADVPDANVFEL